MSQDRLPSHILKRASLRGGEYAWLVNDIPLVIEAARAANLSSVGGQLQFGIPEGTCECYWVGVSPKIDKTLPWQQIVQSTADESLRLYRALRDRFDFLAEGTGFPPLDALKAQGGNPADYMCFVWYTLSEDEWRSPRP